MSNGAIGIGVVGTGTVGGAVVRILLGKEELLAGRADGPVRLAMAADLDAARLAELGVPEARRTDSWERLVDSDDVDVVVELIGGAGLAGDVIERALRAGKPVVTANKALLAEKGAPLFALSREKNVPLSFEAAVCGAIPVIRAVRDGFVADRIESLFGIVNGTCNYILTQMLNEGQDYATALADAQELGYAEADPTFDVEGFDSAHKLALLSSLAFDTTPDFETIHVEGVSGLALGDVRAACEFGYVVKLLAVARPTDGQLHLSVHPALLPRSHPMAAVSGSLNAVALDCDEAQEAVFSGRGAGDRPTASAVVGDIVEIARALRAGALRAVWTPPETNRLELGAMEDYRCRYFLRFSVNDEYGVLGRICTILGEHRVSIASAAQRESEPQAGVPVVLLTHEAREGDVNAALDEIGRQDFITAPTGMFRVEA